MMGHISGFCVASHRLLDRCDLISIWGKVFASYRAPAHFIGKEEVEDHAVLTILHTFGFEQDFSRMK